MNWKQNFDRSTLMQGWRLVQNRLIHDLYRDGNVYQAVVYDPYRKENELVQAQIENGEIVYLQCSCPYGRKGSLCSHEAALLFVLESLDSLDQVPDLSKNKADEPIPANQKKKQVQEPAADDWESKAHESHLHEEILTKPEKQPVKKQEVPIYHAEENNGIETQPAESSERVKKDIKPDTIQDDEKKNKPETEPSVSVNQTEKADEKEKPEKVQEKQQSSEKGGLHNLIYSLEPEKLAAFVLGEARTNPAFRQKLELVLFGSFPEEMMDTMFSEVDGLINSSSNQNQGFYFRDEESLVKNLYSLLKQRLNLLIASSYLAEAFEVIRYAESSLNDLNLSTDPEKIWQLFEQSLNEILLDSGSGLQDDIFAWIESRLDHRIEYPAEKRVLESILGGSFDQDRFAERKLHLLYEKLEEENRKMRANRFEEPKRDEVLRKIAMLLSSHPQYADQREEFLKKYQDSMAIQEMEVEEALALNEPQMAIDILQKMISNLPEGSMKAAVRIRQLSDLLMENNQSEQASRILKPYIRNSRHVNAKDLFRLQKVVSSQEMDQILSEIEGSLPVYILAEYYQSSGSKDQLMDLIEKNKDTLLLEQYEDVLEPEYPDRTMKIWIESADEQAVLSDHRSYDLAVSHLKKAARTETGKKKAAELAASWKTKYPRKHGLLGRLEEAGF